MLSDFMGFPGESVVESLRANAGDVRDMDSVSRGRLPRSRKWQSTTVFLPGNSMDRGTWQATVHGVARVGHDLATKERRRDKCYNT